MTAPPGLQRERLFLQGVVAVLACVPILVGLAGACAGIAAFDTRLGAVEPGEAFDAPNRDVDSHVRYLSGLMLAIGLGFWSTVPAIEARGCRFRLLAALVLVGGLARLTAALRLGLPGTGMVCGLVLELLVTPVLALWRESLERRLGCGAARP